MLQTTSKALSAQTNTQQTTATGKSNEFGSVFSQIMSTTNKPTTTESTTAPVTLEGVEVVLATDSLEELLDTLGIPTDENMLFAFVGEGEQPVAIDQMLTLEDLTAALGMTEEELTAIVQKLIGEETPITDVWSIIEQAPAILTEIVAVLQGNQQNVTPKEAQQIVQFLKLAELLGSKTDTMYQQEVQLSQLKETLQNALTQVQQSTAQQEAPKPVFQQVIQQVVPQTAQQTVKQETDLTQTTAVQQQTMTQTKTVTITLPAEKPAQSEALLKEIQAIINRSQLSGQQGNMKLLLKLYPENLGQIRIELIQKDGILTARLLASTALGKDLLDSNLNQLKSAFVAQNIQMERIDISQSLQDTERNTRDQSLFSNFFKQQAKEEEKDHEDDEEGESLSFSELLNEEV